MTQEMRIIKKELRRFAREIADFEKRSKMSKIVHKFELCNRYHIQINVTKRNKVVEKMIDYIKQFCAVDEIENDGTVWLRNFDWFAEDDDTKPEYDVCLCFNM